MVQGSEGVSLALETPEPVRIAREDFREDFDRDIAMQLRVARAIDLAHSAFAQLVEDAVRPKGLSYHRILRSRAAAGSRRSSPTVSLASEDGPPAPRESLISYEPRREPEVRGIDGRL